MDSESDHWRVAALLLQRHGAMALRFLAVVTVALFAMTRLAPAQTVPVKGLASLSKADGYARLVITLDQQVDAEVRVSGQILIVQFKKPVDIAVGKLPDDAPDYITTARRDPDGSAIRFALGQKVTPNVIPAGERLFVDLLPLGWKGMPPALPHGIVTELAQRARAAELQLQNRRIGAAAKPPPTVRVRASVQPTFVRLAFDVADDVNVTSDLRRDRLRLQFGSPISFDLVDARVAAPADITDISQSSDDDTSTVEIAFRNGLDIRSFREDKSYIVDIGAPAAVAAADLVKAAPAALAALPLETARPRVEADSPAAAVIAATRPEPPPPASPQPSASSQPAVEPPAALSPPPAASSAATVAVEASRTRDHMRLTFPFAERTGAAMFRRADALWLVFDGVVPIALDALAKIAASPFSEFSVVPLAQGQAVRLRLSRPQLAGLAAEDRQWVLTIADTMPSAPQPLMLTRSANANRNGAVIAFDRPGRLHRLSDPDSGETLVVVTGAAPIRGFLRRQDLVDFRVLESGHGVVIAPHSDDLVVAIDADRIALDRPGGLTLSAAQASAATRGAALTPVLFDPAMWEADRQGLFTERLGALMRAAASAAADQRVAARLDVARFYLARGFFTEAKGVLDIALEDHKQGAEDPVLLATHAVAAILAGRVADGVKSLDAPALGSRHDADLWRALALAEQEKWLEAREKFKNTEQAVPQLPAELQRAVLVSAAKAFVNARDYGGAASRLLELRLIGAPPELAPRIALLRGRLAEALGRDADARPDYAEAIQSADRAAAAEATLRDVALRQRRNEIESDELLSTLETLAVSWRGDAVEIETLRLLSRQYAALGRFRDSFAATRAATRLRPNAEMVREMQDEASASFVALFLGGKADGLPPVDALGLFYEYRDLTPIGRRGDEMIRRLADRLVGVDLLDQASELLQYQIDHRLEGAARAQVAARLAMVYLMNRKPHRAIGALQATRISDLAGELRLQRLLIEGRAQSDIGRTDLALDIVANIGGREAIRLRSDIYWAAKRWREAAEQIEVLYGERWKGFEPLSDAERADILRAAIGYALAEDDLGISRLREKYAAKFDTGPDRAALDLASRPARGSAAELGRLAKMAASVDTLDGFLRDIRARFSDGATRVTQTPPDLGNADPVRTGALPAIPATRAMPVRR